MTVSDEERAARKEETRQAKLRASAELQSLRTNCVQNAKKCEMFTRHRAISQRRFPGVRAPMSLSLLWDVERPKPHTIGSCGASHLKKW